MTQTSGERTWRLRPGLLSEKWIRWGIFLAGVSLGAMGFLWHNGPGARLSVLAVVCWPIPTLVVSVFLALRGGTWVIGVLRGRGLFGQVRLEGGRLEAPGVSLNLAQRIGMDGRRQAAVIEQYYSGAFKTGGGYRRTHRGRDLHVFAMCVQLAQDDQTATLYGDVTGEGAGPNVEGLRLRDLGFPAPCGRPLRLYPDDLAGLLRALRAEAAEMPNQAMTTDAPAPAKLWTKDPRRLFAPRTKLVPGVLVLLAALAVGPVLYAQRLGRQADAGRDVLAAELAREQRQVETEMAALVGRWVRVDDRFKKGIHGCGWVTSTEIEPLTPSTDRQFWSPRYTVLLDRVCETATGRVIPADETVWCNGIYVKKGDTIGVPRKSVTAEAAPPGVVPPPGLSPGPTTVPTTVPTPAAGT